MNNLPECIGNHLFNSNNGKPYKILEIYCYGGLSPWETVWLTKKEDKFNYFGFDSVLNELLEKGKSIKQPIEFTNSIFWGPAISDFLNENNFSNVRMIAMKTTESCKHEELAGYTFTGIKTGSGISIGSPIQVFSKTNSHIYYPFFDEETSERPGDSKNFFNTCYRSLFISGTEQFPACKLNEIIKSDTTQTKFHFVTGTGQDRERFLTKPSW